MTNPWLFLAGLNGFISVGCGALAAHGLKAKLDPEMLEVFRTAALYQMFHALALLGLACLSARRRSPWEPIAGWSFNLGILFFSGSLYLLALTGSETIGWLTPLGGVLMLAGWVALVLVSSGRSPSGRAPSQSCSAPSTEGGSDQPRSGQS